MTQGKEKLYLPNALFMLVAHAIGFIGIYAAFLGYWKEETLILGFVMFCVSGLGITIGYHRYFTHRSFKCGKVLQTILAIIGVTAVQNSVKSWVHDHVRHHQVTDKEGDPYNASRGFWHSHIGWIIFKDPDREKGDYSAANHLMKDPFTASLVNFQHRYYIPLAILFSGIVPALIASLWGDLWGGLIFAGFSRLILVWNMTFCINSLAHMKHWGSSQPYTRANSAQDSWMVSFVTFGEGYHNYHHAFPRDYRNGPVWSNFDPSKWIIYGLSLLGVTQDLFRIPGVQIEESRISTSKRE